VIAQPVAQGQEGGLLSLPVEEFRFRPFSGGDLREDGREVTSNHWF